MFTILDTVVDEAIATTKFACDLGACKGACCTTPGGRGAPLADEELELIREAIPVVLPYLPERNQAIISATDGIEGTPGDYATICLDQRDCVFVYYEGAVAKCGIERAHFDGKTPFRKPISCHLFPIRVNELFEGAYLRYERIPECRPAVAQGERKGIPLYKFLKDPLVRAFGPEYYAELVRKIESRDSKTKQRR